MGWLKCSGSKEKEAADNYRFLLRPAVIAPHRENIAAVQRTAIGITLSKAKASAPAAKQSKAETPNKSLSFPRTAAFTAGTSGLAATARTAAANSRAAKSTFAQRNSTRPARMIRRGSRLGAPQKNMTFFLNLSIPQVRRFARENNTRKGRGA